MIILHILSCLHQIIPYKKLVKNEITIECSDITLTDNYSEVVPLK